MVKIYVHIILTSHNDDVAHASDIALIKTVLSISLSSLVSE